MPIKRHYKLTLMLSDQEKEDLFRLAELDGINASDFIRRAIREAAKKEASS